MSINILSHRFVSLKERLFPQFISINCNLSYGKVETIGRGDSWSLDMSKRKAFGEAVERLALVKGLPIYTALNSPLTSNGIAFQKTREDAIANSLNELMERELVINAWAKNAPVQSLEKTAIDRYPDHIKGLLDFAYNEFGIRHHLLYFGNADNVHTVGVSFQSDCPPYLTLGYASKNNLILAFEKALLECCSVFERYRLYSVKLNSLKSKNKSIENIIYFAENRIDLSSVFPGIEVRNSIELFAADIDFSKCTSLTFEMKRVGLPGFVCRSEGVDFFNFSGGSLKSSFCNRAEGDVHPIG